MFYLAMWKRVLVIIKMTKKSAKSTRDLKEKSKRLMQEYERLLKEANSLENEANDIRINEALIRRLSSTHYQLLQELAERDLVEFNITKEGYYLAGKEEFEGPKDGDIYLALIKRNNSGNLPSHRSLRGCLYSIKNLVGYYHGFITPETTGQEDQGDLVLVNPSLQSPEVLVGGPIHIPLEAIVSYEVLKKGI
jgi:hypothetical protein